MLKLLTNGFKYLVRLITAGGIVYGGLVSILILLRYTIGERPLIPGFGSPVGMFNSMLQIALTPALIFVLLFVLLRRRWALMIQLPAVILFTTLYGGNFIPRGTPVAAADAAELPTLTLLAYNVYAANTDAPAVLAIIRNANADLVLLQELTEPMSAALTAALTDEYPHQRVYPEGLSVAGAGVLSRYPISAEETWHNIMSQQRMVLQVGAETITVFNVHPPIPYLFGADGTRRSQVLADILDRAATVPGRVIIAGDFNMGDGSEDYRKVAARYTDAFKVAGYGFGLSFPDWSRYPLPYGFVPVLARLDYVFYSPGFRAVEAWTSHTSGGSDHRPVYVELALTELPVPDRALSMSN